ncbi:MAG: sodium:solute symporter family protein [Succinivibrionaceae bacterium]|nr:sodium:solute symporter family protein [Succinivibrionaceae bacterium]
MELSLTHILMMLLTMLAIIASGILAAGRARTSEGFSLNGRKGSWPMVCGAVAGASIGGGSTIGTSQMAFSCGLSAIWFTLGVGIGLIFMAVFFAGPLRRSGLETISQVLIGCYGRQSGPVASIIASIGIFFSCLASMLPAIWLLSAMLGVSVYAAGAALMILIAVYIYFGGMKGAAVSGIMKTVFIWSMLTVTGFTAWDLLSDLPDPHLAFPEDSWFDVFSIGPGRCLENIFSLIVGITCSQTYAQAVFSATDARTARIGLLSAAAVSMPVGIPCVLAAMYMHAAHPETQAILALPSFALNYLHPVVAGITIGALMMSLVSSVSGLTFGISTMLSRDICSPLFGLQTDRAVLRCNKILILLISAGVIGFALAHLDSQVLTWNFLSMSLRGSIFIPLAMAIMGWRRMAALWAVPSMLMSCLAAVVSREFLSLDIPPLFIGFIASSTVVFIGIVASRRLNHSLLKISARLRLAVSKRAKMLHRSHDKTIM